VRCVFLPRNRSMSFFEVDGDACRRCGGCMEECPVLVLIADKETGAPKMRTGGEDVCLQCGHCVSVCKFGAVRLAPMPDGQFVPLDRGLRISGVQAEQFLRSRRSIRCFRQRPVPHDTLERIVRTADWAPSASHRQPVRWLMVEDPNATQHMASLVIDWMTELRREQPDVAKQYGVAGLIAAWRKGQDCILRGAPHLAVAYTDTATGWSDVDASIALTYLELAAHAHGVGACWAGYFIHAVRESEALRVRLGLNDGQRICGAQMLGYARYGYHRVPMRKELPVRWIS